MRTAWSRPVVPVIRGSTLGRGSRTASQFSTCSPTQRQLLSRQDASARQLAQGFLSECVKESPVIIPTPMSTCCRRRSTAVGACLRVSPCVAGRRARSRRRPAVTRAPVALRAQQQEKATQLKPYEPNKAEVLVNKLEEQFITGDLHWHPFFQSAYAGGGFTLGAGYLTHVGSYNTLDLRGSYTFSGYNRIESEFRAPRLFDRRGTLSVLGGWREATQVGFYGVGTDNTSRTTGPTTASAQPYVSATLDVRPTRNALLLAGGVEYSQWEQRPGRRHRAVGRRGLHARRRCPVWARSPPTCTRRARWPSTGATSPATRAAAATTASRSTTTPTRTTSTASARSTTTRSSTSRSFGTRGCSRCTGASRPPTRTTTKTIPFFMLPALGGGSSLRGFASWRFRDRHSLLLQAEWRVLVNSFFDTAIFYDAGKVTAEPVGSRPRRPQERLRDRLPPARPGGDAAAHRVRQGQRRARPRLFGEGRVLRTGR